MRWLLTLTILGLAVCEPAKRTTPAALMEQRGKLVTHERQGLKFELFLPTAWQPLPSSPLPVIVFLHGRGESGGFDVTNAQSLPLQLLTNASFAATFPFIAIVPQCPHECASANHWLPSTLQAVTGLLREWVLQPADGGTLAGGSLGGDRSRVYLAGQSMGGHGAWMYASQQPRLFAALVVVCGYMHGPREEKAVAERLSHSRLPVAVYHSADDVVIPVAASEQAVDALRQQGYEGGAPHGGYPGAVTSTVGARPPTPLRFVRYAHAPGPPMPEFAHLLGHGSYELAFRDDGLYAWLLTHNCHRCSAKPPAAWNALAGPAHAEGDELR